VLGGLGRTRAAAGDAERRSAVGPARNRHGRATAPLGGSSLSLGSRAGPKGAPQVEPRSPPVRQGKPATSAATGCSPKALALRLARRPFPPEPVRAETR